MRLGSLLLVVLLARHAAAQATDTAPRAPGATVSGVVLDNIARVPLAGAMVQIVAADGSTRFGRTTLSDSLGRFALADLPTGRYTLGFYHPMLDSLGVESPLRAVLVEDNRPVRADLAIPSPARLRAAICGPRAADYRAVVVGTVRDAKDGAPAIGAIVSGAWLEYSFTEAGSVRRTPRLVATTGERGWFALCDVPTAGAMTLLASRGADSTDLIEVQVPADGFLRRELFLGPAHTVIAADTSPRSDTRASATRRVHLGDGRLNGTVVAAVGGRPVAGVQVSIADGPQTLANVRGEWALADVPLGTRMLEVRAVGYYPERRGVNVVAGAPPVRVELSRLEAVLDTVRVIASRLADQRLSGFEDRRRNGVGRYLTAEDIMRRQPIVTTDLFRMLPGVRFELDTNGFDKKILMRGSVEEMCSPGIYLNGRNLNGLTAGDGTSVPVLAADDIDTWVRPNEIVGIEIYAGPGVPPQFQQGLNGCGSILIWTR